MMRTKLAAAVMLAVLALAPSARADDKLAGSWKLQSWIAEEVESKEQKAIFGEQPNGYLILTREGRMMGLLTAQGRKAPQNEAERDAAFRSMLAYSGRYRLDGGKFITKVDTAWNEAWVGSEQAREFRLEGGVLQVMSPPSSNPAFGGKPARGIFTFVRESN